MVVGLEYFCDVSDVAVRKDYKEYVWVGFFGLIVRSSI